MVRAVVSYPNQSQGACQISEALLSPLLSRFLGQAFANRQSSFSAGKALLPLPNAILPRVFGVFCKCRDLGLLVWSQGKPINFYAGKFALEIVQAVAQLR
jgi:hypothetical protein